MATITTIENITSTDKFKIWIEKINALKVNVETLANEIDSKAPISHANKTDIYGLGTNTLYGHLKVTDVISNDSTIKGTAISPYAVYQVKEIADVASANADKALEDIDAINEKIGEIEEASEDYAPINHATTSTKYGLATASSGITLAVYGHTKLSNDLNISSYVDGLAATPYAVYKVNTKVDDIISVIPTDENNEYVKLAPEYHASLESKYGLGTSLLYGHIKLTDSPDGKNSADTSIGASQKAVNTVYEYAKGISSNLETLESEVAPNYHASSETTYGLGDASLYGHLKLSDSLTDANSDASVGIAATPYAVSQVNSKVEELSDDLQDLTDNSAPTNHASEEKIYGIGTGTLYGHVMLSDDSSAENDVSKGIAATPASVDKVRELAQSAIDNLSNYAPLNHASAEVTYGLGTSELYGHVKVSDTYESEVSGSGIVGSQKAVYDVYTYATEVNALAEANKSILDDAISVGQLQNIVELDENANLNNITNSGNYYTTNPLKTLGYPYDDDNSDMYIVNVYSTEDGKVYQIITTENSIYTRSSEDGTTWDSWNAIYTSSDDDLQDITSEDLNSIVETGNYISSASSIEKHYPYSDSDNTDAYNLTVYSNGDDAYQLLTTENSLWVRFSVDDEWSCLVSKKDGINVYVSPTGDSSNDGLSEATAVKTFEDAIKVIKTHTNVSRDNIVNIYFDENEWGTVDFRNFNSKINLYSYSNVLPEFTDLIFDNTRATIFGDIQVDNISLENDAFVNFDENSSLKVFSINVDNSDLSINELLNPVTVFSKEDTSINSIITCTNNGNLYINKNIISISDDIDSEYVLVLDKNSFAYLSDEITYGISNYSGKKYNIKGISSVYNTKEQLDKIIGSEGVIEVNSIIAGLPYGGGTKEAFLRDDLTWGVPNQKVVTKALTESEYTITIEDRNNLIVAVNECEITLPESVESGFTFKVKNVSNSNVTIKNATDTTIDSQNEDLTVFPFETYELVQYADDGKSWIIASSMSILGELSVSDLYSKL